MTKLSEVIDFNPRVPLEKGRMYAFVGMERIQPGIRYVKSAVDKLFAGGGTRFMHGDTLFARITPCLENGKIAQFVADDGVCGFGSTEYFVLRAKQDVADPAFVFYLSQLDEVRQTAIKSMAGSDGRQRAKPEALHELDIFIPELKTQEKIGQLLSTYDDLIEANRRRIALLEESARLLYREWFVDLRFPGADAAAFVDGLPVGWERRNLYDVADLTMGYPFQAAMFNSEGIGKPAIRIRDILDGKPGTWTTEDPINPDYEVNRGDFLIGMDGFFHMNHWSAEPAWLVQRACRVRAKNSLYRAYIAFALHEPIKHFEATISGATVAHLGAKHLRSIELLLPPVSLECELIQLNELLDQKVLLAETINLLTQARDALLPKLMSGAIRV